MRLHIVVTVCLIAWLALGSAGCSGDPDQVTVDFSKTLPLARPKQSSGEAGTLRGAVAAMISPRETFIHYRQILDYLARKSGKDLEFVQRKTYWEINELLRKGEIDLAFICSGPYASAKVQYGFVPLAVPEVQGSTFYRSYLIVNRNSPFHRLEDLKGQTFAFTDPDSNTGKLVPTFWLTELKERPETFFSQIIYTYSHDNSILAVDRGLVAAAAVDGLVWDYYRATNPAFTSKTRIIKRSEEYGIPPLVASGRLPAAERQRLERALLTMHQDPEGKKILSGLLIDRFLPLQEEWYEPIRAMQRRLAQLKEQSHAPEP
ncbi:MAG: phosphate/phosphite/phosphonate ABC transporter substrate-binding protein [Deltaproteobacteria bacterium]|nr:phosphate/phosphite/phosphonate ABC transporter substrate-binding protein [Deltaproteobacteria bacterium]